MSLQFVNHGEEVLNQIIRSFECSIGFTESCEICLLHLIEGFGLSYEQPDGDRGSKFLDALQIDRDVHLSLLEGLQVTVHSSLCSRVAQLFNFLPEGETIVLTLLPPLEHIGRERIEITLPLPPFFRFGEGSLFKPVSDG